MSHITDRSGFVMHRGRIVKPTMCQSARRTTMNRTSTTGDIRALTGDELNSVSGGMKAVVFVDRMFMTIEADANHYGVVVRPGFEHTCVSFGGDGC
ncbi:MAG: hypothetical protein BGN91_10380 [Nitrobacter sp. 62-13]|nr:MAG: hypothetical protein BGN91_10380 [Nitrobacter sp. 62-13]